MRLTDCLCCQGIGTRRLHWSGRTSIPNHLARGATMSDAIGASGGGAGLGVDTRQYNAHTTATDLLWGGAVYLTVAGEPQAARVAAGLAIAQGVPDLVTHSEKEYEDVAADLSCRAPDATLREVHRFGGTGVAATERLLGSVGWQAGRWRQASMAQFGWLQKAVMEGKTSMPLFDGVKWVGALEEQLAKAWAARG